jgi:hypothetical protein
VLSQIEHRLLLSTQALTAIRDRWRNETPLPRRRVMESSSLARHCSVQPKSIGLRDVRSSIHRQSYLEHKRHPSTYVYRNPPAGGRTANWAMDDDRRQSRANGERGWNPRTGRVSAQQFLTAVAFQRGARDRNYVRGMMGNCTTSPISIQKGRTAAAGAPMQSRYEQLRVSTQCQ